MSTYNDRLYYHNPHEGKLINFIDDRNFSDLSRSGSSESETE